MRSRFESGPRRWLCAALALCAAWAIALLAATAPAGTQKRSRAHSPSAKKSPPTKAAELPVPFRAGERLDYEAQWNKFVTAATIRVAVRERRGFYGLEAWHFQANAHTLDPVRLLYTLDDQFDSYTAATSLASLQYEAYIREQAKKQDLIVPMASTTGNDPQPSRGNTHVYLVLPGTRDPLGLLYSLRAHDWQREPSARWPVFDGKHYYDVAAQLEGAESGVRVAAGSFNVVRIALRISEGGRELPNVKFRVSLAQDAARTPALIEAEVPFGTVRVELTAKR